MVGIASEFELDTATAERGLRHLSSWDIDSLAFDVGQLIESSTQRRIAEEKTGPDGEPWAEWSSDYASTRRSAQSLLVGEGDLLRSIQNYSMGSEVRVGTNLVYGAIQQMGGDTSQGHPKIPARPFLGLSDQDRRDIEDLVAGDLQEVVQ